MKNLALLRGLYKHQVLATALLHGRQLSALGTGQGLQGLLAARLAAGEGTSGGQTLSSVATAAQAALHGFIASQSSGAAQLAQSKIAAVGQLTAPALTPLPCPPPAGIASALLETPVPPKAPAQLSRARFPQSRASSRGAGAGSGQLPGTKVSTSSATFLLQVAGREKEPSPAGVARGAAPTDSSAVGNMANAVRPRATSPMQVGTAVPSGEILRSSTPVERAETKGDTPAPSAFGGGVISIESHSGVSEVSDGLVAPLMSRSSPAGESSSKIRQTAQGDVNMAAAPEHELISGERVWPPMTQQPAQDAPELDDAAQTARGEAT
eukprot:scaffold2870_cov267-Pinguiococcus_pyrenoidosus.AAC.5